MEKKDLINLLNNILLPNGFKRKGNFWVFDSIGLIKILKIQKSQYSNLYYIELGFNIKYLKDKSIDMHVYTGLKENDEYKIKYINQLFDFENDIEDDIRIFGITSIIDENLQILFNNINTVDELREFVLENKNIKQMVPGNVLDFLGLDYN